MRRNYCLLRIALLLVIGGAFLLPRNCRADGTSRLGLSSGGTFSLNAGFWQAASPSQHGPAALTIILQEDNELTGLFTIQGNTYSVTGHWDADGNLDFRSGRTRVRGEGKLQDLTRGGALFQGTFKFSSGEKGKVILLQNFTQPPDPGPPDISGSHRGTFTNILCLLAGTDELTIQQDHTPGGAPGTGFTGQETMDGGTPAVVLYQFAGTIDGQGNFVRFGVSDQGFLIIEGGKLESGQLTGSATRHDDANLDGAADSVYIFSR